MDSIKAVILCGGESKRMGQDKSLMNYHGLPQGQYMYELIKELGIEVFISCRSEQAHQFEQFPLVIDQYNDIGPISGLLSAFESFEKSSILVIGCDYPLLDQKEIQHWLAARDTVKEATMLSTSMNQIEPTLCIYEKTAYQAIRKAYEKGQYSLRKALVNMDVHTVISQDKSALLQANTPEEMDIIRRHLHSDKAIET